MRPDRLEKINSWFLEQMERLKAEGASEEELNDPAAADLALRKIFEEHFDEIRTDPDLTDETFALVSNRASPEELCEIAVQAQEEGISEIGHYLQVITDLSGWAAYIVRAFLSLNEKKPSLMSTENADSENRFYDYYGEYLAGRNIRYHALQTVAQLHMLAGDQDPPNRNTAIQALFEVLGPGGTGTTLEDSAAIYDKLREDAGLYRLK